MFDIPHLLRSSRYTGFWYCNVSDTFPSKRSIFARLTERNLEREKIYYLDDTIKENFHFSLLFFPAWKIPGHEMRKYYSLHFL